jgi:hypothetical protein
MGADQLVFSDPWWDLRGGEDQEARMRQAVAEELGREAGGGHPLAGTEVAVVARCTACDDVVVKLPDERPAVVHLTWSGRVERSPWPRTAIFASAAEAQRGIDWHSE